MDSLENYLEKVINGVRATDDKYASLMRPNLKTHSIPFFGDIKNARVLTVGVNPSNKEFIKRDWCETMTARELEDRLCRYFSYDKVAPHKWFQTWSNALFPLGVSYQEGSAHLAAHLDLSPRATVSMGSANPDTFLAMVKEDARWFFELLPECKATRLMLIAGSVTGRYYMDEFVECVAYRYGYKLEEPPTPRGKGFGFNCLIGPGIDLPIFFSSLSPSSPKLEQRQKLVDRVKDNREKLLEYIK